jgi:hypothetical protein
MSETFQRIKELVTARDYRVSEHAATELEEDGILPLDAVNGVAGAWVVEDYPEFAKGPCVLVLAHDSDSRPIHVLWGLRKGTERPAVMITAYRPDPEQWSDDFRRRLQ